MPKIVNRIAKSDGVEGLHVSWECESQEVADGLWLHHAPGLKCLFLSFSKSPQDQGISAIMYFRGDEDAIVVNIVRTVEAHQRKGYATRLYKELLRRFGRVVSDSTITTAGQKIWERLAADGIAVKFGKRGDPDSRHEARL